MGNAKILSIDGGGVFGLIPASLFAKHYPFRIFDCFGGTSIGAAIAAYYACGFDESKLVDLMMSAFPDIFKSSFWRNMNPCCSKYPSDGLAKFLSSTFGDLKLRDVKKPLFIAAFNFATQSPKVFSSVGLQDADVLVKDAVLASVSAPTYFPPSGDYVDGGLWANNPSVMTAAGWTRGFNCEMDNVSVFSVGTGNFVPAKTNNMSDATSWNILSWATKIIPAMLDGGSVKGYEFIASELPFKAYKRWNEVPLESDWSMDDVRYLNDIKAQAGFFQENFDLAFNNWLKEADATVS